MSQNKIAAFMFGALAVLIFGAYLVAPDKVTKILTPTVAPSPSPEPWPPMVGERYALAKKLPCWSDESALAQADEALQAKDEEGFTQLAVQYSAFPHVGDTLRALKYNVFNGHLKVRFLSGGLSGQACWLVSTENIFSRQL